jgi:hypothetical protein
LRIVPGTLLFTSAWLPKTKETNADGSIQVDLDPVTFSAVMASVGKLYLVDAVIEDLESHRRKETSTKGGESD